MASWDCPAASAGGIWKPSSSSSRWNGLPNRTNQVPAAWPFTITAACWYPMSWSLVRINATPELPAAEPVV